MDIWDISGAVKPIGNVLVYDDHGGHQSLDAVEALTRTATICTTRSNTPRSTTARPSPPTFLTLRPQTAVHNPDGRMVPYRIGDAVAGRNIPTAILDAYGLRTAVWPTPSNLDPSTILAVVLFTAGLGPRESPREL